MSSSSVPEARKITSLPDKSSTHVSFHGPPPTRKLAHGWVTVNGTLVSVPVGLSPARSYVPTQYCPWCRLDMSPRRGWTVSPLIGWSLKASPSAVQSLRVPVSKSRLSGLPSLPTGRAPSSSARRDSGRSASKQSARRYMEAPRGGPEGGG